VSTPEYGYDKPVLGVDLGPLIVPPPSTGLTPGTARLLESLHSSRLGIDTSELVDALLGIVHEPNDDSREARSAEPARVTIRPRGRSYSYERKGKPRLWCELAYAIVCTEHGELPGYVVHLTNAHAYAVRHLESEHQA
jgi:hypothetical protein